MGSATSVSTTYRVLRAVALAAAVLSVAMVLVTVALRITYPYELEWMEGGVLDHVDRIGAGEPIYVSPGFRFVPFVYPPLYYYLSSWMMRLTGDGFLGPRLLSLLGSIGSAALIFLFVQRETRQRFAALCAAAFYVATYWTVDGWFDLARVDGLFPLPLLGAAYFIRFGHRTSTAILAGLLLCCAYFIKQSAMVFAAPLLLFCFVYQPRRFLVLLATSVVPCALLTTHLHWRSDGWFMYYLFELPRGHALEPWGFGGFWLHDLAPHVPVALAMTAVLLVARRRRWYRRPTTAFYIALGASGIGVSWLSRMHSGGGINVIIPALATLAVFFGLAIAYLPDGLPLRSETGRRRWKAAVLAAVIVQFLLLARNPLDWIPTAADRQAGDRLLARIQTFPGDVVVPTAPYLARRAGKRTTAHHMALMDVLRAGGNSEIKENLVAEMNREMRDPRCEAMFLFLREGWFQEPPIPDDLICAARLVDGPDVFRPKSGARQFAPIYLFVRRRPVR